MKFDQNFDLKTVKELSKLGIHNVSDLLFYFPFRHEDFSQVLKISEITENDQVSIKATVKQIKAVPGFRKFMNRAEAVISDDSGSLKVVWFNQSYLTKYLEAGDEVFLAGTARVYKNVLQLQNPIWEKIFTEAQQESIHTGRIIPVYRLSGNLTLRALRIAMHHALKQAQKQPAQIKETLPMEMIEALDFPDILETLQNIHFPESKEAFERAKRRVAFEEIFHVQLAVQKHLKDLAVNKAFPIAFNKHLVQEFLDALPFTLTDAQKKATWEILQDISLPRPMNRLLEGDVGSGKTAVAFTVAAEVLGSGKQVVMLCPTEILAQQHYATALKYFKAYKHISQVLLTGSRAMINGQKAGKQSLLQELSHGGAQLIISTHAALQKNVQFDNIALIIIDEQHRFGVRQRAELREKRQGEHHPHTLSMSATPIPRTLRLSILGDLAITQIKHKPPGRKQVISRLVTPDERDGAYAFIEKELTAGRQAFVITPLIEQNDKLGVKAATTEQENLQKIFKRFKVGLLHGKMKTDEKEEVMRQFLNKELHILVSTSVIEVGVDVPNASVIVIEAAERFGLAQLHQFRGRVGRSDIQSYCLLCNENDKAKALERLQKFTETTDGFELAEIDLKNRGFGNIFGEEQSGFYTFRYFSFYEHKELTDFAQDWAKRLIGNDPELNDYPYLKEKIEEKVIHNE